MTLVWLLFLGLTFLGTSCGRGSKLARIGHSWDLYVIEIPPGPHGRLLGGRPMDSGIAQKQCSSQGHLRMGSFGVIQVQAGGAFTGQYCGTLDQQALPPTHLF